MRSPPGCLPARETMAPDRLEAGSYTLTFLRTSPVLSLRPQAYTELSIRLTLNVKAQSRGAGRPQTCPLPDRPHCGRARAVSDWTLSRPAIAHNAVRGINLKQDQSAIWGCCRAALPAQAAPCRRHRAAWLAARRDSPMVSGLHGGKACAHSRIIQSLALQHGA